MYMLKVGKVLYILNIEELFYLLNIEKLMYRLNVEKLILFVLVMLQIQLRECGFLHTLS